MSPSETNSNSNFVETKQNTNSNLGKSAVNTSSIETLDNDPLLGKAEIIAQKFNVKDKESLIKKGPTMIWNLLKGDKKFSELNKEDKDIAWKLGKGLLIATIPLLIAEAIIVLPFALVGFTLFYAAKVAIKAVQSGYKGLKWSAEKTVEGAKHIGGKIKDGAVYVKDKVGDGYENSVDSLKRGASFVSERAANKLHKAAGKEDYLDKIKRFTPKQVGKSDEIRKDLKEIFADKGNNSGLIQDILSGISLRIDSKIKEKAESGQIDQTFERLLEQGKFISGLSKESLHSLLTQRSLPKDTYLIDSIFSEHHDEIKEVIRECKEEHTRFNTLESLNKSAKRHKAGSMNSLRSSSMDSLSTTSSEAELLNPKERKEVKAPTSLWSKLSSSLKGGKKPEEATYIRYQDSELDQIQSAEIGNSRFYVAPEKPPRSNSMGSLSTDSTATTSSFASYRRNSDSGFNSPSSSPQHGIFTEKNGKLKTQADLRKTGSLDKLVGPSSTVTVDTEVEQQASKINGK